MSTMAEIAASAWSANEESRFGDGPHSPYAGRPATTPGGVSYESLPPGDFALLSVPSGVYARAMWTQENRRKVELEQMEKEERKALMDERSRALYSKVQGERLRAKGRDVAAMNACKQSKWLSSQADRYELLEDIRVSSMVQKHTIETKVRLAKAASAGRVAAARAVALEKKQAARQEEALRQRFALEEKARRLQNLREEHAKRYSRKFVPAGTDWATSQVYRYSPAFRPSSAGTPQLTQSLPPASEAHRLARAQPRLRIGSSASAAGLNLA